MVSKKNKHKNSKRVVEESPRTSEASCSNTPVPRPALSPCTPQPNRPCISTTISPSLPPENMLRPDIRKALSRASVERLQSAYLTYGREKRNFSQLSSTSLGSPSKQANLGNEIDVETQMKYHLQISKERVKVVDLAFETTQATLKELRENYKEGLLHISRDQFKAEIQRLEEQAGNLLVEKVHRRTSTYELAAKEIDTERWDKRAHAEDWAYIELLASRLKEPSKATLTMKNARDPDDQARWRRAVIKAYGAEGTKSTPSFHWCPISQTNLEPVTAAHIVRYNVGEPAAVHLFGPSNNPGGHIWSTKNGIPLFATYEHMLYDAEIAIVPTKDGQDLMVIVLDEEKRMEEPDPDSILPSGRALHGRILKFKTNHRPSMRYLYFAFVMNLLRREKFGVPGWWRDRLEYANIPFFPTPGNWVRETTLRKLAIKIGHMPIQEADEFMSTVRGAPLEDPFPKKENKREAEKEDEDGEDAEKEEVFSSILQYAYWS